jgi:hypothetical protein
MASHTVMPKKLAMALMEAGVHHFDVGGTVNASSAGVSSTPLSGPTNIGQGQSIGGPAGGTLGKLLGNNDFSAAGTKIQQGTNADQLNNAYTNANTGIASSQNLAAQLQPAATSAIQNQQSLAQMLLNQANGSGPNPAQAALNQNTGVNVANQAALMAGQRGASANPALIAQLAAKNGANIEQQAVGQSAVQQAQQQIMAQEALRQLAAQQVGQAQSANAGQNQAALEEQNILQGANTAANNAAVSAQNNINTVNAGVSAANAKTGVGLGGLLNSASQAIPGIASMFGGSSGGASTIAGGVGDTLGGAGAAGADLLGSGGPALLASDGAKVPGKPDHPGNDPRNDVVPALLSKGEDVIPNSITQIKDPKVRDAKVLEFMHHLEASKDKKDGGYEKVASAKKSLKERVEALEKCMGGRI